MARYDNMLEEELKNRVREDYFPHFHSPEILGRIDFAIGAHKSDNARQEELFEKEWLLWAEAKKGTKANIYDALTQLVITIGKEKTHEKHTPPPYLGAFDAEKMAFIEYSKINHIFTQNDFNWNVTPSNHDTREFKLVRDTVKHALNDGLRIFYYKDDDVELKQFIRDNLKKGNTSAKIQITINNFISIFQKWDKAVRPTIDIDWDSAKKENLLSADFFLADILSKENMPIHKALRALLMNTVYILDKTKSHLGSIHTQVVIFKDNQKAHKQFWNRYERPPEEKYIDELISRRDLLVPQDVRERKGSFFTPQIWVEKSQEYLAAVLGEDWQDEYYIWDCCAGTGNLLNGLKDKYKIWASTLDKGDVDVMKERSLNGANLLEDHIFQFDFLNDEFDKLPEGLRKIVQDPEKRKKLLIYINPPYAEASTATTVANTGANKTDVAKNNNTYNKYAELLGKSIRELFAQFFIRINDELSGVVLGEFSTLKILQAPNFSEFRKNFQAKLKKMFLMPANTFDNVKGKFPIGFFIWDTNKKEIFSHIKADVYNEAGDSLGKKTIFCLKKQKTINQWLKNYEDSTDELSAMCCIGTDFQHSNYVNIDFRENIKGVGNAKGIAKFGITTNNIISTCIYFSVRHSIEATWLNDRDQFLYPNDGWQKDKEFQSDCLAFTLFHCQNRISSEQGVNHWIPFREMEVNPKDAFESHFMGDFIRGKIKKDKERSNLLFKEANTSSMYDGTIPMTFSPEAQSVMDAGRELWCYYHAQPNSKHNASFYDIRMHFQGTKVTARGKTQMSPKSDDIKYNELIKDLRDKLKVLAKKIEPKVYEYGFLR